MDKRKVIQCICVGICVVLLGLGSVGYIRYDKSAKHPFTSRELSKVERVSVIFGAYEPYYLSEEEEEQFLELLEDVVIYERDNTYREYTGVGFTSFGIEKTNGKTIYIQASNPFFIINDVGYRTKYEPCDEISRFGYEIVHSKIKKNSM